MIEIDVTRVCTLGITKTQDIYEKLNLLGQLQHGIFLAPDLPSIEVELPFEVRANITLLVTDMTAPEVTRALYSDMPKWQFTRVILLTRRAPSDPLPEVHGVKFRYVDPDLEAGLIQRWMRCAARQGESRRLAA